MNWLRRISALAIVLALAGSNAAVCAGWAPTPEARMACCVEDGTCPMHQGKSHESGPDHLLTQTQADQCCVASEGETSRPSIPTFVAAISFAVLGPGTILPVSVPARVLSDEWRIVAPLPTTPVPKHVLLSVFLV